jgi:hypothetical protein
MVTLFQIERNFVFGLVSLQTINIVSCHITNTFPDLWKMSVHHMFSVIICDVECIVHMCLHFDGAALFIIPEHVLGTSKGHDY